jgi:hypothetical protein
MALSSVDAAVLCHHLPTNAAEDPINVLCMHLLAQAFGFTDSGSHILQAADDWIQGYNCQAAMDGDHQIIVATGGAIRRQTSTIFL